MPPYNITPSPAIYIDTLNWLKMQETFRKGAVTEKKYGKRLKFWKKVEEEGVGGKKKQVKIHNISVISKCYGILLV